MLTTSQFNSNKLTQVVRVDESPARTATVSMEIDPAYDHVRKVNLLSVGQEKQIKAAINAMPKDEEVIIFRNIKKLWPFLDSYRIFYLKSAHILIVTIPSTLHEIACTYFNYTLTQFVMQIDPIGKYIIPSGASRLPGKMSEKEADASFQANDEDKPTVVVEVGFSQNQRQLRVAANWWFDNYQSVNMVITIQVLKDPKQLILVFTIYEPRDHGMDMRSHKSDHSVYAYPVYSERWEDSGPPTVFHAGPSIRNPAISIPAASFFMNSQVPLELQGALSHLEISDNMWARFFANMRRKHRRHYDLPEPSRPSSPPPLSQSNPPSPRSSISSLTPPSSDQSE